MSKPSKTAPWDSLRPPGPSVEPTEPPSFELEVELDLGRPARGPRGQRPATGSEARPERPPADPSAGARRSGPPDAPELSLAEEALSSYSTEDSISFWSLQAASSGRGPAIDGEPLSGTDEVFDPATGWDFAAVSDGDLRAHRQEPEEPAPPARSVVSNVPDWGEPAREDEPAPWADSPAPGSSFSDLPAPSRLSQEAPLPDLDGVPLALPTPGPAKVSFDPDPPSATSGPVVFDPDGFFSVADVPGPAGAAPASAPMGARPAGEPPALEESAEFEFDIDDDPVSELDEDDIYSQSALPAVPPDLALLPVSEAVVRARELFADDDPDLGMAILQAARMRAPTDTRVETWLEFGERRLMVRYAPGARTDRVPVLQLPKDKLLRVTAGDQAALIAAIDGERDLTQLRRALPQLPVVGFWKDVGKLLERGWLGWSD